MEITTVEVFASLTSMSKIRKMWFFMQKNSEGDFMITLSKKMRTASTGRKMTLTRAPWEESHSVRTANTLEIIHKAKPKGACCNNSSRNSELTKGEKWKQN